MATAPVSRAATFGDDAAFLDKHTSLIVLSDKSEQSKVALAPAWQGRVMTSTAGGNSGHSFGWVNRELIASGKLEPHINVFGGEDRFWLGPEGGQYSIFFAKGAKFEISDWYTPPALDTLPFRVARQSRSSVTFHADFSVTNYSGTEFQVGVERRVELLPPKKAVSSLGLELGQELKVVAYESKNKLSNSGRTPWTKEAGLLSIWILGMFNASPETAIVVPIESGNEAELGRKVTSDYFGTIPADRLVVKDNVVFFKADANYRSKIGINPQRSKGALGSYDAQHKVLTIVQFTQPKGVSDYVNSLWKLQDDPYAGDAANAYNDGPTAPGAKQLGQFYELESSSPAAALKPGKSLVHRHRTIHLAGPEDQLDKASRAALGVPLQCIASAFATP
jgi:hypothetical protein